MPPGRLHEIVVRGCNKEAIGFQLATPKDYQSRISVDLSTTFQEFKGVYRGSCKIPDLVILSKDNNKREIPRIVVEIGITESYEHLKQSAKLWLEGMTGVKECNIINIQETPNYKSPSIKKIDFPALDRILPSAFICKSKFGPVMYKDLRWTGTISTAFLETWTLDPLTKLATQSGKRTVRC